MTSGRFCKRPPLLMTCMTCLLSMSRRWSQQTRSAMHYLDVVMSPTESCQDAAMLSPSVHGSHRLFAYSNVAIAVCIQQSPAGHTRSCTRTWLHLVWQDAQTAQHQSMQPVVLPKAVCPCCVYVCSELHELAVRVPATAWYVLVQVKHDDLKEAAAKFVEALVAGKEFIADHKPTQTEVLDQGIKAVNEELLSLLGSLHEGLYVDAVSPPADVVNALEQLQERLAQLKVLYMLFEIHQACALDAC